MRIISFTNKKGGCGKTTDAINVSVGLAKKGYHCLLIDADPQGNSTDYLAQKSNEFSDKEIHRIREQFDTSGDALAVLNDFFNVEDFEYTMSDMLMHPEVAVKAIVHTRYENLDFVPATLDLIATDKYLKMETIGISTRLKKAMKQIKKQGYEYDFVIIDYAPTSNTITLNSYIITGDDGKVIIPIKIDKAGVKGLVATLNDMNDVKERSELDLEFDYLIHFTMVNRNKNDQKIIELLNHLFKDKVLQSNVRYQAKPVSQASLNNQALIETKSPVANDYLALIDEIEREMNV